MSRNRFFFSMENNTSSVSNSITVNFQNATNECCSLSGVFYRVPNGTSGSYPGQWLAPGETRMNISGNINSTYWEWDINPSGTVQGTVELKEALSVPVNLGTYAGDNWTLEPGQTSLSFSFDPAKSSTEKVPEFAAAMLV